MADEIYVSQQVTEVFWVDEDNLKVSQVVIEVFWKESADVTDNQAVYLTGGTSALQAQPVYLRGGSEVLDSQGVFLAGQDQATSAQPIYLASSVGESIGDTQPVFLQGQSSLQDSQPVYVVASNDLTDYQSVYLVGQQTVANNQPVYLSGYEPLVMDHQPVYLVGGQALQDSQPAYLFGGSGATDHQPIYLVGEGLVMRIVDTDTQNAITLGTAYRINTQLVIEPTWMYFDAFTSGSNFSPAFADDPGIQDDPVAQDITFIPSNNKAVTFYIDSGSLKYQVEGSSTVVTVVAASGKPGVYGGYIFFINGSNQLVRYALDFAAIVAESSSIFTGGPAISASVDSGGIVHGISDTACVLLESNEGGIKAILHIYDNGDWTSYAQANRFMFPIEYDYTSGSPSLQRSFYSLAIFSGAAMLNGDAYAYISNSLTGSVEGIKWDSDSKVWSDIFVAVASDIKASICEFRVANCYVVNDVVYISGQFRRNENVDTELVYNMILRSSTGKIFSMDRFSLVSDLNYRLLAGFYNEDIYLAGCNKVGIQDATWLFGGSGLSLTIPQARIVSLDESDLAKLSVSFGDANEVYMNHAYMEIGSKVTLNVAYETVSSGSDYYPYGTYFIDGITCGIADGERSTGIQAISQSLWQLQGMNSPYYSEILSKSSAFDGLTSAEDTQLSAAEMCGYNESMFSVDFWESEAFTDGALGITGIVIHSRGGVDMKGLDGFHRSGIKTRDLKIELGCEDYPVFTSGSPATFKIYGWSFDNREAGSSNDMVELALWLEDDQGNETQYVTSGSYRWPCTYPSDASGDIPIVVSVSQNEGTIIKRIGLVFSASNDTAVYPARVDCTSGTRTFYRGEGSNSGWYSADDELWKVRKKGYPNIMFSRQPYDAFNFQVEATFNEDLSLQVSDFGPVAFGLVGLAEDGRNYIAGRFNKITQEVEIIKSRDSVEITLTSGSPSTIPTGECSLMFTHKDGHFEMFVKNGSGVWVSEISYDWQESDGWMFTSDINSKHVGIYGYINVPHFRIVALNEGGDPDIDKAQGIPLLPGESSLEYFPTSGSPLCDIGDRIYQYNDVVPMANVRGPYQYRQHDEYEEPYGDGWGIEIRDHDWNMSAGTFSGYLLGIDDGYVYLIEDSFWQVWDRQDGNDRDLPGRARLYCSPAILKKAYHTLSNKAYITGGLRSSSLRYGDATIEAWGETCFLHVNGNIQLLSFRASSGDVDVTVEDLVERIASSSGASAVFPGDYTADTLNLTADTPYQVVSIPYSESLDIRYASPLVSVSGWIGIDTNAILDELYPSSTGTRIRLLRESSSVYNLQLIGIGSGTADQHRFTMTDAAYSFRFLLHGNYATVYINDIWVHTFHVSSISYPSNVIGYIVSSATQSVTSVRVPELNDWREAVYIDLETDGMSAIGSIIQERPVELFSKYDGSLKVWYDPTRTTVAQTIYPRRHQWTKQLPKRAASDAIVYYSDVKTLLNNDYRDNFGFATKVYRMPNLDIGAVRAAYLQLKNYFRERMMHTIDVRPDIRLELGDKLYVAYTATGTGTAKEFTLTIDSLSFRINYGNSVMNIQGRGV